jgi:mevalonate kinase
MAPSMARPLAEGRACGKLILFGEHFVVHGAPALALPLTALGTQVAVHDDPEAEEIELTTDAPPGLAPLARQVVTRASERLGLADRPWRLEARSTVPIGHGLGSSASFAVALLRALAAAGRKELSPQALNVHALALEELVHGSPSGIDNTVVTHQQPLWFVKGQPPVFLGTSPGLRFVLASSGHPGSTREAVATVAALRTHNPQRFEELGQRAREIAEQGREAFEAADARTLGPLMSANHELLQALGVSTRGLDRLVSAAHKAGALGAKLTGAGRGGFAVALVNDDEEEKVMDGLRQAGADQVLSFGAEAY